MRITRKLSVFFLLLSIIAALFSGCMNGLSGDSIIVAGSSSVQPYAELLAEFYMKNPGDGERGAVNVTGGGSSQGLSMVRSGHADIGMVSKKLTSEQQAEFWHYELAIDAIAVITHPNNSVKSLTVEQIRRIYTREYTTWTQLDPNWKVETGRKNDAIHLFAREEGSGTRGAFYDLVMGGNKIAPSAIVMSANGSIRRAVSDDINAIGFISLVQVECLPGQKPVNALNLIATDGSIIEPCEENIASGAYSLARPFMLIAKSEPTGSAADFIAFVQSPDGRQILTQKGLIVRTSDQTGGSQ